VVGCKRLEVRLVFVQHNSIGVGYADGNKRSLLDGQSLRRAVATSTFFSSMYMKWPSSSETVAVEKGAAENTLKDRGKKGDSQGRIEDGFI
jgi:hypothetical protein